MLKLITNGLRKVCFTFCLICITFCSIAQLSQIRFEHLDMRDGLSHNRVNSIYKDQLGFIWFGTSAGLNRYDGHEIKVITIDDKDPLSPSDPNFVWIKEGPGQFLWLKTGYGVFAYDIFKERYVDIRPLLGELQINTYNLSDIVKDHLGNYWLVITEVGVKRYIADSQTVHHYGGAYRDVTLVQPDHKGNMALIHLDGEIELVNVDDPRQTGFLHYPGHIQNIREFSVYIDFDGDYWFYSTGDSFGVCCYDPETNTCKHFDKKELGSSVVSGVIQDKSGRVIVGVDHGGVNMISKSDWSIQSFRNSPTDPKSLSHNSIISMYYDRSGLIWLGTNKGGVNYFTPKSASFKFFKQTNNPTPNANDMWPLVEDKKGNLWIGTDGGGLVYFNLQTGQFTNYTHNLEDPNSISSNIIVSMSKAADGGMWFGTYMAGLNYFDGSKFRHYFMDPDDPNAISDNSIWKLYLDSNKNLWVGTLKNGIDVYDSTFTKINHFGLDNQTINSSYITSVCEDKEGKIWVGTGYGIEIFDPKTKSFTHHLKEEGNPQTLSNNSIIDIYCDRDNNMWISTMYGLNVYNRSTGKFTSYTKKDGLPENIIAAALQDESGNMWFSTYKGISKLEFKNSEAVFHNFDISDGLQGDMFNGRSALHLSNGDLAFGGKNGLNIFNPQDIHIAESENKLVFLDFYISNHQISPGATYNGRTWFEEGINNVNEITLKPFENSFTIEFTSLNFYQQENLVYKYRLVGFDKEWVVRPNVHRANYTNLDPGNYRFEVMVTDQSDNGVDEAIMMDINVLTPLWKTPVAYAIYVVLILAGLFLTRRSIIQKERFRAKVAHDQLEAQRLHEIDLMKIKFFTNISHEFRTPLTLIMTPIERLLMSDKYPDENNNFQLIYRNAKRLLTLVNQLLDFRKMEANQHRMSLATGDIVAFINSTVESFSDLSNDRMIRLEFQSELKEFLTLFDRDKMEKIMFNLLSNAFKFTNTGGKVTVRLEKVGQHDGKHMIQISVIDTGIGIAKERHHQVFNRFFQVENDQTINVNKGTGIGLSITKEFVEMHEGEIWLESEPEHGSSFIFKLPMKKLAGQYESFGDLDGVDEDFKSGLPSKPSKDTILLVDDNDDFRFYLRDNLKDRFNIKEASNGKQGWKKILQEVPDLVVTDIMMPEINGIDLCRKIKKDPRSAHVPVILLTANYSDSQKLEGFESGAIEYITKPFNFEILVRAIHSAVQLQKMIHSSEKRVEVKPGEVEIIPQDELFIKKAIEVVEENLSNPDLSVQELSRELAVSRGQLYKKTLEITGMTPIEFIRSIRIQRAAALLGKSQLNVAEVAYKVGFNNPKNFTKYFKQAYKVIPSRYVSSEDNEASS